MRVIGSRDAEGKTNANTKIQHVYLLHNGLNETVDLLFHYRLAAWIVGDRPNAVCILRPLPGHLTRFPFDGSYAEQPLDGYLRDPADLFRQFLRYMQETQWLLSALVPRSRYAVLAGTRLLAEREPSNSSRKAVGRASLSTLSAALREDWKAAYDNNERAKTRHKGQRQTHFRRPVGEGTIRDVITELREVLNWRPVVSQDGPLKPTKDRQPLPEAPCIHVVGYSMGGFMAQAAFFAWPFAISSCTNLFAGGALRDLAPTAFAHPEEWQAVLHGLRYELDRAFQEDYLDVRANRIAGINKNDFGYFTRIFYEVYLQYYRGGYASRVAEHSRRLLFIVGGGDPIVRTENVLDAGPPEGMTLLQIADVSHFPNGRSHGDSDDAKVESEQRQYWLPEVGRVVAKFSERSEQLLHNTLAAYWGADKDSGLRHADPPANKGRSSLRPPPDRDPTMLASVAFANELGTLVRCVKPRSKSTDSGYLLIARNEVPPMFLSQLAFRYHGQALHHSEEKIGEYVKLLHQRATLLEKYKDRLTLIIPNKSEKWFTEDAVQRTFFSKSETPSAARLPTAEERQSMWKFFEENWIAAGAVRMFAADEYPKADLGDLGIAAGSKPLVDRLSLTVLPDVWIAISASVAKAIRYQGDDREGNENAVIAWATRLLVERRLEEAEDEEDSDGLQKRLDDGGVVVVSVSAGELNPRYRGRRLRDADDARKALVHWGLSRLASQ